MTTTDEARPRGFNSRASTIAIMAVTAVIILGVTYLTNRPSVASGGGSGFTSVVLSGRARGPGPIVGKPAPDFTGTTLDGKQFKLSALRGHPVWLTFGASWCQPCRAENPDIEAEYKKHRAQGLEVVAVFISEPASDPRAYAARVGLTYQKVTDSDNLIATEYRIVGIPSHFFIDRTGVLRILRIGSLDPPLMETNLAKIGVGAPRAGATQ
jgi:cytochrome c biogenesis protein CcmG, thiol:disulfide interchange protein DsbE